MRIPLQLRLIHTLYLLREIEPFANQKFQWRYLENIRPRGLMINFKTKTKKITNAFSPFLICSTSMSRGIISRVDVMFLGSVILRIRWMVSSPDELTAATSSSSRYMTCFVCSTIALNKAHHINTSWCICSKNPQNINKTWQGKCLFCHLRINRLVLRWNLCSIGHLRMAILDKYKICWNVKAVMDDTLKQMKIYQRLFLQET